MKLTDAQLLKLRGRCIQAATRGYAIGQISKYLKDLASETGVVDPPAGVKAGSAEHLQALVEETLGQRSGKIKKVKKEKTEKVVTPPKPVAPPKPAPAPEPEPEPAPKVPPYEEWSYEELYAEAKVRNISGRSKMDKDELVAAMYEDDASA